MYTSRNYKHYIKLRWDNNYEILGQDVTLEQLRERRREKVLYQRSLGFMQRIVIRLVTEIIREEAFKQGMIDEMGVFRFDKM